ncbi:MAG TPA: enolase C-terminal domain-like protein [Candidatus Didemnitutus sp.]|nr:enolase C-terminal domain-like protein [Candidatus Didemnitutus sp.]
MNTTLIDRLEVRAFRVPTDRPESDGTLEWDHTGLVVVKVGCGRTRGLGWTYGSRAIVSLIEDILRPVVVGGDPFATEQLWQKMNRHLRNAGNRSLGAMAIAAVDVALWDLRARLLDRPLLSLWGTAREEVTVYGSGGFTSYTDRQLARQLAGWVEDGISSVKMKVGREPARDPHRVSVARRAIGAANLMVDANGAYAVKEAAAMAERFQSSSVVWFEEPVSSENREGLALLRRRAPAAMEIAAGEYGDTPIYFLRLLQAGAVDCLQADVTRCGGFTGFLKVAALAESFQIPLSAHCAPQLHAHVGSAAASVRHVEYFHDHVRIGKLLFDGCLPARNGTLRPDRARAGHGLVFKEADAAKYAV